MLAHVITGTGLAVAGLVVVSPADGGVFWMALVTYGPSVVAWTLAALAAVGAWVLARLGAAGVTRALFVELGAHARDIVLEVWQTYVEAIKADRADGTLTVDERATARAMAIAKLRERLSWGKLLALGGGWLTRIFAGSKWASKVESILGGAVETAVAESKRDARAATPVTNVLATPAAMSTAGIPPRAGEQPPALPPPPPGPPFAR